jgi:hypothetical protein
VTVRAGRVANLHELERMDAVERLAFVLSADDKIPQGQRDFAGA